MKKRMLIMLVGVGILFGGIFGYQAFRGYMIHKFMSARSAPVATVSTVKAVYQPWQSLTEAVGTLRAVRGADLAPEVAGVVRAIHFRSGEDVKAGTLLLELNSAAEHAQLEALEAAAELVETTYKRDREQYKVKAVSRATLDLDAANLKSARAQVAQQQALIDKKEIRAPFSGHLGIRAVDIGQFLGPGTKIVTLQALDPIYVDFLVPQRLLARVTAGRPVTLRTDAVPGAEFTGTVSAVDPKIDPATRNAQVRATLKNPKHVLLPGMFATVELATAAPQRRLTLPQTAISYNPYGNTVFVVEEKKGADGKVALVAQQRFVTTGDARGDQIAILTGLKEGDTVVSAGQLKLRSGTQVVINNTIQPSNEAAPQVKDE